MKNPILTSLSALIFALPFAACTGDDADDMGRSTGTTMDTTDTSVSGTSSTGTTTDTTGTSTDTSTGATGYGTSVGEVTPSPSPTNPGDPNRPRGQAR